MSPSWSTPSRLSAVLENSPRNGGATPYAFRQRLAAKAYARTAAYDAAISGWFADNLGIAAPQWRTFGGRLREPLRYGENPHQQAGFYLTGESAPRASRRAPGAGQAAFLQQHQRHRRRLRAGRRIRS
jgi:AICAR transformylase/IMP cyclohydrolase PurH